MPQHNQKSFFEDDTKYSLVGLQKEYGKYQFWLKLVLLWYKEHHFTKADIMNRVNEIFGE